jgi:hypothetical protein
MHFNSIQQRGRLARQEEAKPVHMCREREFDALRGASAPTSPRPQRLTRREVRLVCSLINDGDRDFLGALLAHVRVDSQVARAVVRGICRAPDMLTPEAAENLLTLLRHQGQPKYPRNLALEVVRTFEFATSFGVIEQCAEILSEHAGSLTAGQSRKLMGRAVSYPAGRYMHAWPADPEQGSRWSELDSDSIDYGGAVSVLLLSKISKNHFREGKLLAQAVRFAHMHPESANLWLDPLSEHAPRALRNWQSYLCGEAPRRHLIGGLTRAVAATALPWLSLQFAAWMIGAPRPPAVLFASVLGLSPLWGLQIGLSVKRDLRRWAQTYQVADTQKNQVLKTTARKTLQGDGRQR